MKHFCIFIILVILPVSFISAQSSDIEFLKEVDRMVTFNTTDIAAEYKIVKRDPGGANSTTVATMFRRDRANQFVILILEPVVDKGKGYLKIGDNLWLYDPIDRSFTFTSAKERFQNSSARNSDFNQSNLSNDYKVTGSQKAKLGVFNCTILELEALNDRVSFPKRKIWVSEDYLIRKIEDYSMSGQLMRTTAIPNYQTVGDRWLPVNMVILDHLRSKRINNKIEYERTTITISKPSLSELPDTLFSKEYLERVNR
ncbi:MAG: outer membrane lipoprotein-sorting protein [Spirochaetales bacterium]|nr:outer membrane lipoprotein-sorting protein [Spirochaetales bacterium]